MTTWLAPALALSLLTAPLGVAPVAPRGVAPVAPLGSAPAEPLEGGLPSCISYHAQARGSVGYDHLVTVTNACSRAATCSVATDVNPAAIRITVAAGGSETVVTFRGSPAREFTARVACSLS